MADHPHTFQGNIEIISIPFLKEILIFCEQEVNDTQFLYLAMFYFFSFDIRISLEYNDFPKRINSFKSNVHRIQLNPELFTFLLTLKLISYFHLKTLS